MNSFLQVPGQSDPEENQSVGALYCPAGDVLAKSASEPQEARQIGKQTRRQVSELWADIEDLLALENGDHSASVPRRAGTPVGTNALPTSRNSEVTQTTTPDFSLLIATGSPRPATGDAQEVPLGSWPENCDSSTCQVPSQPLVAEVPSETRVAVDQIGTEQRKPVPLHDGTVLTSLNTVSVGTVAERTTANEGTRGTMEGVMHQMRNPLIADYGHYDVYNNGFDVMDDVDSFMQGGPCGVVLEERIRYACTVLDIPMGK